MEECMMKEEEVMLEKNDMIRPYDSGGKVAEGETALENWTE